MRKNDEGEVGGTTEDVYELVFVMGPLEAFIESLVAASLERDIVTSTSEVRRPAIGVLFRALVDATMIESRVIAVDSKVTDVAVEAIVLLSSLSLITVLAEILVFVGGTVVVVLV